MSLSNKMAVAETKGRVRERGRILWLISEIEKELQGNLKTKVMSEAQMHIATTKLRLFIAMSKKLKRAIVSDVKPADVVPDTLPEDL